MTYKLGFTKRADKDLRDLPPQVQARIVVKLRCLQEDLSGDVKKLTNFTPEYRLRIGDYRVLFEIEDNTGTIIIQVRSLSTASDTVKMPIKEEAMDALELHPSFIEREGKKEFAVLSYDEFVKVQAFIEDARDLFTLRQAKAEDDGTRVSLSEIEARLRNELGEGWDEGLDNT